MWTALLVLLLAGPTLVVPIEAWHEHHDDDGGNCGVCALARQLVAPPCDPGPALTVAAVSDVEREPASVEPGVHPVLPIHERAPPFCLLSA